MVTSSKHCEFADKGRTVEIKLPFPKQTSDPIVNTTTTQLQVKDVAGDVVLDVPQLYSTIDASKTAWSLKNETLTIVLQKLSPNEAWTDICAKEGPTPASRQGTDSEGAMEARELLKQLFEAALHGRLDDLQAIAPRLSTSGLNSVKDGNGRNALHFAAQGGQVETVQYLLEGEGVGVNSQDDQGQTPLCLAAGGGQVETARLLLKQGANVLKAKPMQPQPLHRAAATGNTEIVAFLLEAGADVEAPSESGTPLLWAAGSGSRPVVAELLNAGANPNAQTPDGVSAMLMAAASGDAQIIEQLASHGADASLPATGGVTALHAAAEQGDVSTVQALLKAGADPNAADADSDAKPIHAAAFSGHASIVELLLPVTHPKKGDTWTVEALMADASTPASSATSPGASEAPESTECKEYNPELAGKCKREGDKAFVGEDYAAAESLYSESLSHDPSNHLVWANRSAAFFRQGRCHEALKDAVHSRELNPKYLKAWYREGEAAKSMEQYETAAQAFYEAYSLDPTSQLLAKEFQEAVARGRRQYTASMAQKQERC